MTTWRAPAWRSHGGGHDADGAGAGDEDVFAEHGEGQRGVDGVAEGIEDGGDFAVDAGCCAARCWSWAGR